MSLTQETFFENFAPLADAPNGVAKLRELILQLAVQGKLVSQDANDEPASVLLARIKAEKERLIQEKKIKKSEPLPPIEAEEAPFDLPQGWEWVRLGNIGTTQTGTTPSTSNPEFFGADFPFIKPADITSHGIRYDKDGLSVKGVENGRLVPANSVLMVSIGGSIGKVGLVDRDCSCNQQINYISLCAETPPKFVFFALLSPYFQTEVLSKAPSTTLPILSKGKWEMIPIQLPPLAEQRRIVAKVDQLMALCDELEARQQRQQSVRVRLNNAALDRMLTARTPEEFSEHWQRICDNFDLLYDAPETVASLRQAILQLAVQGKLVPQDANDEPASVLLAKIKAERERLIQKKKIKKSEPLPPIDANEVPFDLPKGWMWARFPELGEFGRGKSKHRPRNDPKLYKDGYYRLVQTGDVARANGFIQTHTGLYNEVGLSQSRMWPKGTMCITIAANIADSGILGFDACFPDSVVGLVPSAEIGDSKYFEYFMRTAQNRLLDYAPSTAQKNINLGILETVLIPLPPLNEMKRIVAKVDQLMALCDELEAKLRQAQTHSAKLMSATVQHLAAA